MNATKNLKRYGRWLDTQARQLQMLAKSDRFRGIDSSHCWSREPSFGDESGLLR